MATMKQNNSPKQEKYAKSNNLQKQSVKPTGKLTINFILQIKLYLTSISIEFN